MSRLRLALGLAVTALVLSGAAAQTPSLTVPLGGVISKATHFGRRPISLSARSYNVDRPQSSGTSRFRFVISLLHPQAPQPRSQTKAP